LFLSNINGISLELTSKLLPIKTFFDFNLLSHIHIHSKLQNKYSNSSKKVGNIFISKTQLKNLLINLSNTIQNINLKNVVAAGNFSIVSDTGDVKLGHSDAANISVKTSTGNVTGTLLSEKVFITETSTGKINVPKTNNHTQSFPQNPFAGILRG
jgi:DUF4097 and DUF4098 domain-containing protein YvlB